MHVPDNGRLDFGSDLCDERTFSLPKVRFGVRIMLELGLNLG